MIQYPIGGSARSMLMLATQGVPDNLNPSERMSQHYAELVESNTLSSGAAMKAVIYDDLKFRGVKFVSDPVVGDPKFGASASIHVTPTKGKHDYIIYTQASLRERWQTADRIGLIAHMYSNPGKPTRLVLLMYQEHAGESISETMRVAKNAEAKLASPGGRCISLLDAVGLQSFYRDIGVPWP